MESTSSLNDTLIKFGRYLLLDKEYPKATLSQYLKKLKRIMPKELFDKELDQIESQEDYYDALVEIIDRRMKKRSEWAGTASTRNMAVTVAHTFYRFLNEEKGFDIAHKYKCEPPKIHPLNIITETEFEKLISVIPPNNFLSARDRAMFSLMFYAGIRDSEITKLGYQNFKRTENSITHVLVHGKGRKVPIDSKVAEELYKYEELYSQDQNNLPTQLEKSYFRNCRKTGINHRSVRRRLSELEKLSGVRADASSLRNSYGMRLVKEGKSADRLAYLMGVEKHRANCLFKRYKEHSLKKSEKSH